MLNRPHAYALSSSKGLDPGLAHRKPVTLVYHCRPQHLTVPFNRVRKHHIPSVLASGVQVLNEPHEIGQMNTARCHHGQQTRARGPSSDTGEGALSQWSRTRLCSKLSFSPALRCCQNRMCPLPYQATLQRNTPAPASSPETTSHVQLPKHL